MNRQNRIQQTSRKPSEAHTWLRRLILAVFNISGVMTVGGLAVIFFNAWLVALGAVLGGAYGMCIVALCWSAGKEDG